MTNTLLSATQTQKSLSSFCLCWILAVALTSSAAMGQITASPGNAITPHISVTGSGNAPPMSANLFPGPIQFHTTGFRSGSNGDYELSDAFAATEGLFLPTVTPTYIAGLGRATATSYAEDQGALFLGAADARAFFEFEVGLSGPAGTLVPVNVDLFGTASTSLVGGGSASARGRAIGRQIHFSGTNDTPLFDLNTNSPPYGDSAGGSFSHMQTVWMEAGDLIFLRLEAQSSVRSNGGTNSLGTAFATGMVDPSFIIDLNFPQRDQYSLSFSPNLNPVPEPATAAIFGGLLALFLINHRRS